MQHFHHLHTEQRSRLFALPPQSFERHGDKDVLAVALGATLYMPATRPALVDDLDLTHAPRPLDRLLAHLRQ